MQVCVRCKKEMRCDKNGVAVRFCEKGEHGYMDDRFVCPVCNNEIVVTNPESMYDPNAKRATPDDVWMAVDKGYTPKQIPFMVIRKLLNDNGVCTCDGSIHKKGIGCQQ